MLRKAIPAVIFMVAASLGLGAQTVVASPVRPPAEVKILPGGKLAADGAMFSLKVRILCRPIDGIQWEGFLVATQGEVGGGTELNLLPGSAGGICDGRQHVETVAVHIYDFVPFERGEATVSAVIQDENDMLKIYATDARTIKLR